jgi:signal transduction histidine kinase
VATGWSAFLPPEELDLAQRTLEEAIRSRTLYQLEHRMRRHDGQYRWLLAQGAPSFYPNGDLYGYVGSAIDITELKHTNEQLRRTNQDLDNFVYAASHDLKQPVNNLAGLFEELRRSSAFADSAEEQLLVPLVHEALQQLSVTIDDLAALGQAPPTSPAPTELVSLDDLTEEVVNTLEPQVRAARARITTDFAARPALSFARANLRTILLNLLGNSLKYADPARPARIHGSVWVEQGQPVLVVEDNGLGFDAAKHGAELFHLFRRLHTHPAGTGVGLYLVNRIVAANGGRIEVDSQPGEGATFRIRFGAA